MDDGILVVESWLMSATEYIAIDNTLPRPGVHVDGRAGMVRPDQSADHAKLESKQPLFCLYFVTNKHCIPFVYVALGEVARVNQVISIFIAGVYQPCIPGMTVWRLSAAACPLVGLGGGWGHG